MDKATQSLSKKKSHCSFGTFWSEVERKLRREPFPETFRAIAESVENLLSKDVNTDSSSKGSVSSSIGSQSTISKFDHMELLNLIPGQGLPVTLDSSNYANTIAIVSFQGTCPWKFVPVNCNTSSTTSALQNQKTDKDSANELKASKPIDLYLPPGSLCVLMGPARFSFSREITYSTRDVVNDSRLKRTRYSAVVFRMWNVSNEEPLGECKPNNADSVKEASTEQSNATQMSKDLLQDVIKMNELNIRKKKDKSFILNKALLDSMPVLEMKGSGSDIDETKAAVLEKKHVIDVYDAIADHFSGTRYQAWPKVEQFVRNIPANSVLGDIGCGNGKYLALRSDIKAFGCDASEKLVEICKRRGFDVIVADTLSLPYSDNICDAVLSIAVLHHISTLTRRIQALKELIRILKPDTGRLLLTAWAMEQEGGLRTGAQDVWVPWKRPSATQVAVTTTLKHSSSNQSQSSLFKDAIVASVAHETSRALESSTQSSLVSTSIGNAVSSSISQSYNTQGSSDQVNTNDSTAQMHKRDNQSQSCANSTTHDEFKRYCHVYRQGELEELFSLIPGVSIVESYYDRGNWAVIVKKGPNKTSE
jgi:alkylated DNA repair protein alkB family protein 8